MALTRATQLNATTGRVAGPVRVQVSNPANVKSKALLLLLTFWVLTLFEIDQFLTVKTGLPFYRLSLLVAPFIAWSVLEKGSKKGLYWPLIIFTLLHLGARLFAQNAGMAQTPLKFLIYMNLLLASSVAFLDTPAKMQTVLKLYLLSFVWFGLQGIQTPGRVTWHNLLANEDSYGPLMGMLLSVGFFFAGASNSTKWRWIGRVAFVLGALGVVLSFARGAALAAGLSLAYILVRTPNKLRAWSFVILAAILFMPLANSFVSMDAFGAEVATSTEGDDLRTALWKLAWLVFQTSPIYGVGVGNYGVVGIDILTPEISSQLGAGVYMLAVHNSHLQILAEEGIIGVAMWLAMIFSILRWNKYLRSRKAQAVWLERGGSFNLRLISLGLEGAFIAYLGNCVFYNQVYVHWFWTILIMSFVLYHLSGGGSSASVQQTQAHPVVPRRRPNQAA